MPSVLSARPVTGSACPASCSSGAPRRSSHCRTHGSMPPTHTEPASAESASARMGRPVGSVCAGARERPS